ncbi:hypothetical protein J5N97_005021 [Dioscorea zingiberensis]|uniref:Kinesin motor domain-containing protein n=1 Tax=Dioscorea zingiberensis TaxID=325984 RepID=A0A9D5D9N8_9LILI|nr:hypothetical protein J5N97_005021 [Dioscorea zingiberensis]
MESCEDARAASAGQQKECVKVAVNIRPLITSELLMGCADCVTVVPGEPQVQIGSHSFTYDHVYGISGTPHSLIFQECVAPLTDALFNGYNATVLAYGQIFKEEVFDLLDPHLHASLRAEGPAGAKPAVAPRVPIQIRETANGGITLSGVVEAEVRSKEEMASYLARGSLSRATGSTNMNSQSSRSHAIFTICLEQKKINTCSSKVAISDELGDDIISAKLHLVDLAGSERAKRTGADGLRLKEACISPADSNAEETLNTLKYANRARNIQNKAVINRDPVAAQLQRMRNQLEQLQAELSYYRGGGALDELQILRHKISLLEASNADLRQELDEQRMTCESLKQHTLDAQVEKDKLILKIESARSGKSWEEIDGANNSQYAQEVDLVKSYAVKIQELEAQLLKAQSLSKSNQNRLVDCLGLEKDIFLPSLHELASDYEDKNLDVSSEAEEDEKEREHCNLQDRLGKELQELDKRLEQKEKEIEDLRFNLANFSTTPDDSAQKLKEDYLQKLNMLEAQVSELKKKQEAQSQLLRQKQKSDEAAKRLQDEIQRIKSQKVQLQHKIKQESEQFRSWKATREKEVLQLKKEGRRNEYEMHKLLALNQRQKMVLHRKTEEASMATKRLKELLEARKASSRDTYGSGNINGPGIQALMHAIENELEVNLRVHEVRSEYERQMEERAAMAKEVAKLKEESELCKRKMLSDCPQTMSPSARNSRISALENMLATSSTTLVTMASQLSEAEERERVFSGRGRWNQVRSLAEAKNVMNHLFNLASSLRCQLRDIEIRCREKDSIISDLKGKVFNLSSLVRQLEAEKIKLQEQNLQKLAPKRISQDAGGYSGTVLSSSTEDGQYYASCKVKPNGAKSRKNWRKAKVQLVPSNPIPTSAVETNEVPRPRDENIPLRLPRAMDARAQVTNPPLGDRNSVRAEGSLATAKETSSILQPKSPIRWRLSPSEAAVSACPSTLSVSNHGVSQQGRSSALRKLHGVLKAVSPVFMVSSDPRNRIQNPGGVVGFLADISTCKSEACSHCSSVDDVQHLLEQQSIHSFTQQTFLYFVKPTSLWQPVMAKLIGKLILVSGLKKKMVEVGVHSYLMFVATEKTMVSLCQIPFNNMESRVVRPVMNGESVYCGVVTGVYMHGMAVELDNKVWLMITDPLLGPQHSLRVGALSAFVRCHQKEGLAQIYARSYLPEHSFQPKHGVFMEFCKNAAFRSEYNLLPFKLVVPISNFIGKCEAVWMSTISKLRDAQKIVRKSHYNRFSCGKSSYCGLVRRIIPSEDLGCILMGTLKFSSSTGRLQLIDATGKVDAVVSDLRSEINVENIYEVKDYKIVLEGLPTQIYPLRFNLDGPLSCKNIFQRFPYGEVPTGLAIYVHFSLMNSTGVNVPLSCLARVDDQCVRWGELFHLLLVTHKFPATDNFLEVSDISSSCNTYAEAIVLPYYLILPDVYVDNQQSVDLPKRIKSESRCLQCCKTLEKIPCSFTFTSANYQVSVVSGYICNYEGNTWGHMTDAQGFPRILLEFKSDCYHKYQFLRIGGFYIIKCSEEHLGCGLQGCHDFKSGKVLVTSYSTLWSLSFSLDDTPNLGEPPLDCSPGFSSVGVDKTFQEIQHPNEISFQQSGSLMLENSDVLLSFTSEETRPVNKGRSKVQDGFIRLIRSLPKCGNVLSVSACTKIMMDTSISHSVAVDPESVKVPLGNLISVSGNIENIHAYCSKSTSHMGLVNVVNTFELNACSICIHLFEDHHMVRIHGTLSKYAYPVGMAPGVKATFHRVLMTCLEVSEKESLNIASFGLTLDMVQCQESKSIRFNSRVVGIHILVLEESIPCSVKSQSMSALKLPTVNIPLAGVVVDDGSSLRCCWVNAGKADVLLRLGEAFRTFFCRHGKSLMIGSKNFREYCGQCHGFNWSSAVEVSPSGTAVTIAADGKYMD